MRRSATFSGVAVLVSPLLTLAGCADEPRPELQSRSITSVSVSEDGRTIEATWLGGQCDVLGSLVSSADESSTEVGLNVAVATEGDVCTLAAVYRDVSIPLADPLGDRRIVDGEDGGTLTPVPR